MIRTVFRHLHSGKDHSQIYTDKMNTHPRITIHRPLIHSSTPLIYCVLLLRIALCHCLIPATVQLINSHDPSGPDGASSTGNGEVIELDHAIGEKDAAIAFKASADQLINSE